MLPEREGMIINNKKLYRLYRQEGLSVNHALGRKRNVDLNAQSLAVEVVEHVQQPELATIGQTVGHEVHGPHEVQRAWNREHVWLVPLDAPPWLDLQVQFRFAVDPANALVVSGMTTDIALIQEA